MVAKENYSGILQPELNYEVLQQNLVVHRTSVMMILINYLCCQRVLFNNQQSLPPDSSYRASLYYLLKSIHWLLFYLWIWSYTSRWKNSLPHFSCLWILGAVRCLVFQGDSCVQSSLMQSRSKGSTAFLWWWALIVHLDWLLCASSLGNTKVLIFISAISS
jgi:hypothetical protein